MKLLGCNSMHVLTHCKIILGSLYRPGVKVIAGLEFFCVQIIYVIVKIVTPCFNRPSLLSRSKWDSVLDGWIVGSALKDSYEQTQ